MACQVISGTYSAAGEELTSQIVVGPEQGDGFVGYRAEGGQEERYVTARCAVENTRSGEMTDVCQVAERLDVCRLKALFGNKYWQGKCEVDTPGCGEGGGVVADQVGRRLPARHSGEGLRDDSQGLLRPSEWSGELDMQVVAYCWSIPSPLSSLVRSSERKLRGWMGYMGVCRCGVDPWEARIDMCLECENVECGAEMAGSFSLPTTAKFPVQRS
ncbi:hypothetical protein K440DRAFT_641395 [Wilcoxina mikolae CBS 423.85]|nr:hypothetical protein K440DRAFT_641395 [Wilcoxina mikolae CBS 423.85]